jgi:RHS repeat-associated protein
LNRLISAQNAGTDCSVNVLGGKTKFWGNSYGYDAWGNLLQKTVTKCSAENLSLTALANNQLAGYGYDAAGNMTSDPTDGATLVYDAENRIATATKGGVTTTYTYDADGNRVKKSTGSTGTLYWYMSPGIVAESDLNGVTQSEYVFFGGERVARRDGVNGAGGVFYYFSDHLKTASVITDSAGVIKAESDYYPWGGELKFINNDSNHYKFTGKERDAETGLDYFGARYYSSGLGRWVSADWSAAPIAVPYADFGDPQSLNLYTYVRNIPTTGMDPDGHCDNWFCQAAKEQLHIQGGVAIGTVKFVGGAIPGVQIIRNSIHAAKVGNAGLVAEAHATVNALGTMNAVAMGNEKAATQILTAANNAWNNASTTEKSSFLTQAFLTVGSMVLAGNVSGPATAAETMSSQLALPPAAGSNPWVGQITSDVTQVDTVMFRVWGGEAGKVGGWLTPTAPANRLTAIQDLALPPANSAQWVSGVTVPAGTRIQSGTAAAAFGQAGGAPQVLLLDRIPAQNFGPGQALGVPH